MISKSTSLKKKKAQAEYPTRNLLQELEEPQKNLRQQIEWHQSTESSPSLSTRGQRNTHGARAYKKELQLEKVNKKISAPRSIIMH
jgi:hypothetical protein